MNWHRLIVPSGPEQLVRSVYRPWRYANREEVVKEARACAEEVDYEDAKAADIIDTVCAFENRIALTIPKRGVIFCSPMPHRPTRRSWDNPSDIMGILWY